jgi:putative NADPH-quinone reductase
MQWYSVPPLLKLWMDKVLSHGWAYGHNGIALRGKSLMWAVTTGGGESHFDIGSFPGLTCWRSRCRRPALLRHEMAAAVRHALHLYLR